MKLIDLKRLAALVLAAIPGLVQAASVTLETESGVLGANFIKGTNA